MIKLMCDWNETVCLSLKIETLASGMNQNIEQMWIDKFSNMFTILTKQFDWIEKLPPGPGRVPPGGPGGPWIEQINQSKQKFHKRFKI